MSVTTVVGCLLVIGVLVTGGKLKWVGHHSPDARSIALPAEMAGLRDYVDALELGRSRTAAAVSAAAAQLDRTYRTTADAYRKAYPGAGVAVRRYATIDLALVLTVVAVRATSTPLLAGVLDDPADSGLIAQPLEVITIDSVSCLIRRFLHGPGGDLDPLNQETEQCQLSPPGQSGTVWVFAQGADTSTAQQAVVRATIIAFRIVATQSS